MDDAEAGPCVGAQIGSVEHDNQSAQTIVDEGLQAVCAASDRSSGLSKLKRCLKKAYRAVPSADRLPLERTAGSTVAEDCTAYVDVLREMHVLTPGTLEQLSQVTARLSQPTSGAVDASGNGGGPGSAYGVPLPLGDDDARGTPPNDRDTSSRASTLLLAPRPHEPSSASYRPLASASTASSSTLPSAAGHGSSSVLAETGDAPSYLDQRKRRKTEGGERKRARGEETLRRSLGPQEYWRLLGEPFTDGSAEHAGYHVLSSVSSVGEDAWTVHGPEILQRNGVLVYADKSLHRLAMGKELCADSVADIEEMQRRAVSSVAGADESTHRPASTAVARPESFVQASALLPSIKSMVEKQLVQAGLPTDSRISAIRPVCFEPPAPMTARAITGAARRGDGPASPSSNIAAQVALRLISEALEAAERRLYIQSLSRALAESDVTRQVQEGRQGTAGARVKVNYTGLELATAGDSGRSMHPVTAAAEALHRPAVVTAGFDSLRRPDPIDHVMATLPTASQLAKGEADQLRNKPFAIESELELIERHAQRLDACNRELQAHKLRLYGPGPGPGDLRITAPARSGGTDHQGHAAGLAAAPAVLPLVHNTAGSSSVPGSALDTAARPALPRLFAAGSGGREKQGEAGLGSAERAQSPGPLPSLSSAPSSPSTSPLLPQPTDQGSVAQAPRDPSVPASAARSSTTQQGKQAGGAVVAAARAVSPAALRSATPSAVAGAGQSRPGSPLVPSASTSAVGAQPVVKTVQPGSALRSGPAGTAVATAAQGVVKPAPLVRQVSAGVSSAAAGRPTPTAGSSGTTGTGTAVSTAATAVKGPTQSLIAELALKLPTLAKARRLADEQKKAAEVLKPATTSTSTGASTSASGSGSASGSAAVSAAHTSAGTAAMQKGVGSGSVARDTAVSSSGPGESGGDQDLAAEDEDDFADYYGSAGDFLDDRPPSPIGGPEDFQSGVSATSVSSTPLQGRAGGQGALSSSPALDGSGPDYPRPQDVRVEHPWEYMQKVLESEATASVAKSEARERERLEQAVRNTAHNTSSLAIEQWGGHARARGAQSTVHEQRKKLANQLWQRAISGSKPQARASAPYTSRVAGGPVLRWPVAEGLQRPSKQGTSIAGLPKLAPLLSAAEKDVLAAKKARRAHVTLSPSVTVRWLPGMGPCDGLPGLTADSAGERLGKELDKLGLVRFHALPVEEDAYFERNELLKMTHSFRALLRRAFHTPETSAYTSESEPIDFNDDPETAKQKSSKSYDRRISASRARAGQQILEGEGYVPAMPTAGPGVGTGQGSFAGVGGYQQMTHGTTPFMLVGSSYSGNSSPMDGGGTSPMNATTASYHSGIGAEENMSTGGSPFDAGDASPALWQVQQRKSRAGAGVPVAPMGAKKEQASTSSSLTQAAVPLPQRKPERLPFELEAESSFGTRSHQSVHLSYGTLAIAVPTVKSTLPIRIAVRSDRSVDGAHWFGGLLQSVTDDIRGSSGQERARYPLLCSDERCSLASQRIRPGCPFVHPKAGTPSYGCVQAWEAWYGQGTAAVGRSNTLPCPLDVERHAGICVAFPTVRAQSVDRPVCSRYVLHHEACGHARRDMKEIIHPMRSSSAMLDCYEAIVKWWNTIHALQRATDLPFDYGLMIARFYVLHKASEGPKGLAFSQWAARFTTEHLRSLWLARQAQEGAGSSGAVSSAAAGATSTRDSEVVVQAGAGSVRARADYRDDTDYRNAGSAGTSKVARKLDVSLVCSSASRWLRMFECSVLQKLLQCDPAHGMHYRLYNPDPPMRNYVLAWIVHMAMHYTPAAGVVYSVASERAVHDALLALQGAGRPDASQREREVVLGNALQAAEGLLTRIAHLVAHEVIEVSPRRYTVSIQLQPSLCTLPTTLWRVYGCMRHERSRAGLASSVQEIPNTILTQLDNLRPGKEPLWLLSLQVKLYRILLASEAGVSPAPFGGTGQPAVTTTCAWPVEIIDALLHLSVGSNSTDSAMVSQACSYAPVADHLLRRMIALCPGLQYVPGPSITGTMAETTGQAEVQLLSSFRAAAKAFIALHDHSVQYTPGAAATSWRYPFIFQVQAMLLKCPGNCLSSQWVRAAYIASGGPNPSEPLDEAMRAEMTAWQSRILSWLAPSPFLAQDRSSASSATGAAAEATTEHPFIGMLISSSHVSISSEAHYQRIRHSFETGKVSMPDVSFWLDKHCWEPAPKIVWPAVSAAELPQAGFTPLEQSILGFLYDFERPCDARQIESGLREHFASIELKGVPAALRRLSSAPILAVRERKQPQSQSMYDALKSRSYWGRQEVLRAFNAAGVHELSMSKLDACVPAYCRSSTTTLTHIVKDMEKEKAVVLQHEVEGNEHSAVVAVRLARQTSAASSAGVTGRVGGAGAGHATPQAAMTIQLPVSSGTGNPATPLYSETPVDSPAAQACGLQGANSSTLARAFAPSAPSHGPTVEIRDSATGGAGPKPVDATAGSTSVAAGASAHSAEAAVPAAISGAPSSMPAVVTQEQGPGQPAPKRSRLTPPEPKASSQVAVPPLSVPSGSAPAFVTQAQQPAPPLPEVAPTAKASLAMGAASLASLTSADMSIDPDETQPVVTTTGSSPVLAAAAPAIGSSTERRKEKDATPPSGTEAVAVKSTPSSFRRRGLLASHSIAAAQPRGANTSADAASSGSLAQPRVVSPADGDAIRDPDEAVDHGRWGEPKSRSPSHASRRSPDRRYEDRRGTRRSPDRTGHRREEDRRDHRDRDHRQADRAKDRTLEAARRTHYTGEPENDAGARERSTDHRSRRRSYSRSPPSRTRSSGGERGRHEPDTRRPRGYRGGSGYGYERARSRSRSRSRSRDRRRARSPSPRRASSGPANTSGSNASLLSPQVHPRPTGFAVPGSGQARQAHSASEGQNEAERSRFGPDVRFR